MGQVLSLAVSLTSEDCGNCGGVFAVNTTYRQRCYDTGKGTFACPYCKTDWGWTGRGRLQVVEGELRAERERLQRALARENEERLAREKAERKLKRVSNGVCPCCTRSFQNLAAHIKNKHPELVSQQGGKLPKGPPPPPRVKPSEFDRAKARAMARRRIPESG